MLKVLQWVTVATCALMVVGTLVSSVSRSPRWYVRLWDFPRFQIAGLAAGGGALYAWLFFDGHVWEWVLLAAAAACFLWQAHKIFRYTPFAPQRVERSDLARLPRSGAGRDGRPTFRLLISNVLMENTQHERLVKLVRDSDPDVVLAVETDDAWARALEPLAKEYPHVVRQPQENYYGLMLFSRLPLIDPRVEFLVQDDIPSVHTQVELENGVRLTLHGLHPRPPEPIRDQDSTPRDAELVLMGRAIGDTPDTPTVVAGDLNDVAWSPSSELFMRLSGLLDPRLGRGFYNSYNANVPIFRWPLDHVFHSNHFRLVELRRCPSIGSDHFPMLIELSYEPDAPLEQPPEEEQPGDQEEAEEKIEEQVEAAKTGDDRPGRE
jgi:endonuclease/exonuclease/phosphatase (EEP) superfamily protein YafD